MTVSLDDFVGINKAEGVIKYDRCQTIDGIKENIRWVLISGEHTEKIQVSKCKENL